MSAAPLLDAVLALAMLLLALWVADGAARGRDAALGSVAFGLLLSLAWVRLGSVDVALAEAAVGAGAGGVLLLGAAARLEGRQAAAPEDRPGPALRFGIGLLCAAVAAALGAAVLTLPVPAPTLAPAAAAALPATGLGNPVAGVLLAHRAFDALLAALALVLAVVGAWSLAPDGAWGGPPGPRQEAQRHGPLALLARLLPPVGIVVGIHVSWAGATGPGGAVQGGAILAAMWILAWMAGLARPPPVRSRALRLALVAGPALFLAVGLAGFGVAGAFLAAPPRLAEPLSLAVAAALTLSVAVALALLVLGPPEAGAPPR